VTYREAGIHDVEALVRCRVAMQAELDGNTRDLAPLAVALRAYFSETLASGEFFAYVAESEGEIVATSGMVVDRHPPSGGNIGGRIAYIMNMFTVPAFRRQGIASEVLSRLLARARALELKRAVLHGFPQGRGIYEKAGFVACDSEMRLEM